MANDMLVWLRLGSGSYVAAGPTPCASYKVAKRGWPIRWHVYYGGQRLGSRGYDKLIDAQGGALRHRNAQRGKDQPCTTTTMTSPSA